MKKIFIALALFLPMSWAGATWLTSSQTESIFDLAIAHSNEKIFENIPLVKIEKQSFEKGFISSQAESTLTLDEKIVKSEKPVAINFNHTIYHGPVMMTPNGVKSGSSYILTTLDQESLLPETADLLDNIFAGKEPLELGMHTGIGNKIDIDVNMAKLQFDSEKFDLDSKIPAGEAFTVDIEGMTGLFNINAEGTWLKGMINLGALKIVAKKAGEDTNLQMDPSVAEIVYDEIYKGAMLAGSSKITVPAFSMSQGKEAVSIKGLSLQSSVEDNSDNLDAAAVIDVDSLLVKAEPTLTEFPNTSLHLSFGIKGLERGAFINLIDASHDMNRLSAASLTENASNQADEDIIKAAGAYFGALGNLFNQGTESNNVIRIGSEQGGSELLLDITYTDSKKLFDLATIMDLIMALEARLKLNVDKSLLAELPVEENIILLTKRYIQDKGDSYETSALFNGGELKVNDELVPVLDMLGPMTDQALPWQMLKGLM